MKCAPGFTYNGKRESILFDLFTFQETISGPSFYKLVHLLTLSHVLANGHPDAAMVSVE